MRGPLRTLRALVGLLLGALLLSGCDYDVYSLPLPGGADTGDEPIEVTVEFADVLDLVPQSAVKVNDITVGKVTGVDLDGYQAKVSLRLRKDTDLPDNAVASIRQTSLLGEKFVSLAPPTSGASSEPLESGDVIPLERSGRNPEVEEVLGALSLVLNGGGVAQLKTITQELNLALEGREDSARSVLSRLDEFTGTLDDNKADIVRALEALNRLSLAAKEQQPTIDAALEELPSALTSIDRQRADLVRMLQALNRLGDVGVRVIRQSKDSTIASVRSLGPVLRQLANADDDLANSLHVLLTYPFVDDVVGRDPQVARNLHMGDYTNLSIELDVDLSDLRLPQPQLPTPPPVQAVCTPLSEVPDNVPLSDLPEDLCRAAAARVQRCLDDLRDGSADTRACRGLVTRLPQELVDRVCSEVRLPGLPSCPAGGGGGSEGPLGDAGDIIDDLTGLSRAEPGWSKAEGARSPTVGDLQEAYDPALVHLLLPGVMAK